MAKRKASDKEVKSFQEVIKHMLKGIKKVKFVPHAWYNVEGDIIEVFWKDTPYYGKWLNHQITVLHEFETDAVIGVQIWGLDNNGRTEVISKHVKRKAK